MELSVKTPTLGILRYFDFGLALGSLGYGAYTKSWLWIAGGLLGLVLAWLNPGKRIKEFLFVRMKRPLVARVGPDKGFPLPPTTPYVPPATRR